MEMRRLVARLPIAALSCLAACQSSKPDGAALAVASGAQTGAGRDGFRETFAVDKTKLGPTGTGCFFSLHPGAVMSYRDDEGATLTIRVLDETRVVDGVTTRVIEEREETSGKPSEISRNFFAIDPVTGDAYYFGEAVDIYKGGKVTSHPGSWLSGVSGARFGLALPGKPVIGDRYHQELAPGVAMDRAEIAGLDDRVETPAGAFEHCLHVKETTPLDKDVGHKWYAPGVGLVKDDEFVLVSRSPGAR